jgi:hypothetical protein
MDALTKLLQQVTTPLQLVALFLILLAGAAHLVISSKKKPSSAHVKLIVNRFFQASIVALVLGVLSPLAATALGIWVSSRETYLSGEVTSTTGEPIQGASITVTPFGTGSTGVDGKFHVLLPADVSKGTYHVSVSKPGYTSKQSGVVLPGSQEMAVTLTFSPMELEWSDTSPLRVGGFYGAPIIMTRLHIHNNSAVQHTIQIVDAAASANGNSISFPALFLSTMSDDYGYIGPMSFGAPFTIAPNQTVDLRVAIMANAPFQNLMQTLLQLPQYQNGPQPCVGVTQLADDAFKEVQNFAQQYFAWSSGDWTFKADAETDFGQHLSFTRSFKLSDNDIAELKNGIGLAKICQAVNTQSPFAQAGGLSSYLVR